VRPDGDIDGTVRNTRYNLLLLLVTLETAQRFDMHGKGAQALFEG